MNDRPVGAYAWVAVGGAIGALARVFGPFSTLWVNLIGCMLIGLVVPYLEIRVRWRHAREFLVVGVLGGFTTFSGYVLTAAREDDGWHTLGYLLGSGVACVAAAIVTAAVSRRLWTSR